MPASVGLINRVINLYPTFILDNFTAEITNINKNIRITSATTDFFLGSLRVELFRMNLPQLSSCYNSKGRHYFQNFLNNPESLF